MILEVSSVEDVETLPHPSVDYSKKIQPYLNVDEKTMNNTIFFNLVL